MQSQIERHTDVAHKTPAPLRNPDPARQQFHQAVGFGLDKAPDYGLADIRRQPEVPLRFIAAHQVQYMPADLPAARVSWCPRISGRTPQSTRCWYSSTLFTFWAKASQLSLMLDTPRPMVSCVAVSV